LRILDLKCPSGLDGWIDRQKNGYDRFQLWNPGGNGSLSCPFCFSYWPSWTKIHLWLSIAGIIGMYSHILSVQWSCLLSSMILQGRGRGTTGLHCTFQTRLKSFSLTKHPLKFPWGKSNRVNLYIGWSLRIWIFHARPKTLRFLFTLTEVQNDASNSQNMPTLVQSMKKEKSCRSIFT
jgi:hypothetical protein